MNKEEKYRLLTECSQSVRHFVSIFRLSKHKRKT